MTRIYRTWARRIEEGLFSRAQCLQWAKAIVPLADNEGPTITPHGKKTVLTPHEARGLHTLLHTRGGVGLTADHAAAALVWLKANRAEFPDRCIDLFERFTFQGDARNLNLEPGDDDDFTGDWEKTYDDPPDVARWVRTTAPAYYVPVWRIHMKDGGVLDYCTAPWQAMAYDQQGNVRRVRLLEAA